MSSTLLDDLSLAIDPVRFARACLGIEPDDWQAEVLCSTASRMLLNCSRQSGKTTTTAILGLHTALYRPGSLILILSPSQRQSAEFYRTLHRLYERAGAPIDATGESALRLELANGSRVISLPATESTVRGYASVDLLLIDEAARVDDGLYHSVRPMLAVSKGRLLAMSTPWGKRGWWYEAWAGAEAWQRVEVPASRCPRIDRAFLDEERRTLGEWFYRQEYECEFTETTSALFGEDDIEALFSDDVEPFDFTWGVLAEEE